LFFLASSVTAAPRLESIQGRILFEERGRFSEALDTQEIQFGQRVILAPNARATLVIAGSCKVNLFGPRIIRIKDIKTCQEIHVEDLVPLKITKASEADEKITYRSILNESPLLSKGKKVFLPSHQAGNAGPE
jgi:hypothetical protein